MSTIEHSHGHVRLDQLRDRLIRFAPVPAHDPAVVARVHAVDDLEGHLLREARVLGEVDGPHAALAE